MEQCCHQYVYNDFLIHFPNFLNVTKLVNADIANQGFATIGNKKLPAKIFVFLRSSVF